MKHRKVLLSVLSCIVVLLAGCGDDRRDSGQALTETCEQKEENSSESADAAEIFYNQDLLSYVSLQDGYYIADYGESAGTDYSYAVYCMRREEETVTALYWEVVVLKEDSVIDVLRVEDEEHGDAFPQASEMIAEGDVNFDGKNDILICLGHFGNQGAVTYKCFLTGDAGFVYCPGFTEIVNPSVDHTDQVVRSYWRNAAASHGFSIYKYIENEFIEVERLTEEAVYREEDGSRKEEPAWSWKEEVFSDGEWKIREYYTEEDYDPETIAGRLYGPDSYWRLDQAEWNILFNAG